MSTTPGYVLLFPDLVNIQCGIEGWGIKVRSEKYEWGLWGMCLSVLHWVESWMLTRDLVEMPSTWTNYLFPCSQPLYSHLPIQHYNPIMPHRTSMNLCVYNVFSLRPQSTIPCSHQNCPWFFFNLSGCTNHMRATHPSDQPLPDPHSPSPASPSPQSKLNWSPTSSPIMPNPLPTIKHSDIDVATPPSSLGMPSPSIDSASSWALPGVDCVPSWTSPDIDNPSSSGIDYTPSPGVDTPSPDVNSVPCPYHCSHLHPCQMTQKVPPVLKCSHECILCITHILTVGDSQSLNLV